MDKLDIAIGESLWSECAIALAELLWPCPRLTVIDFCRSTVDKLIKAEEKNQIIFFKSNLEIFFNGALEEDDEPSSIDVSHALEMIKLAEVDIEPDSDDQIISAVAGIVSAVTSWRVGVWKKNKDGGLAESQSANAKAKKCWLEVRLDFLGFRNLRPIKNFDEESHAKFHSRLRWAVEAGIF